MQHTQVGGALRSADRHPELVGHAVDFWTEASLFSQAGLTTIVFGPGDIAQAHTADEWVALDQLDTVAEAYLRMMGGALG